MNSCLRNGEIKRGDGYFWHDGIGYRDEGMTLETGFRKGDWRYLSGGITKPAPEEKDLFTLTIDHGVKPQGASYAFAVLPGVTPEEAAVWNGGRVIINSETCQAAGWNDGTIRAIFHAPGKLGNFETDSPGVFLIRGDQLFAADPTAKLERMSVTVNGVKKTILLPQGEEAGRSIGVK